MILETVAAQDPNSATAWILSAAGVVAALIVFWGKLRKLYTSVSETFTNREAVRRELAVLAERFNGMITTQEKIVKSMQEVITNDRLHNKKLDELEKQLHDEQLELNKLREEVAFIKGRLSK